MRRSERDRFSSVRRSPDAFLHADGVTRAVDGVSFAVAAGETLGIVGESGCGKSVTALVDHAAACREKVGRIVGGAIRFEGRDLLALDEAEMREIRGNRIAMIFQEPMTSLNPVLRVGEQIAEAVRIHTGCGPTRGARARPPRCCAWCASRMPRSASTTIRTSSPAACASA